MAMIKEKGNDELSDLVFKMAAFVQHIRHKKVTAPIGKKWLKNKKVRKKNH